jgi:DNA-binding NarL/FixJ family response regulator
VSASGKEALSSITVRLPVLILLDCMMPGMGGSEVTRLPWSFAAEFFCCVNENKLSATVTKMKDALTSGQLALTDKQRVAPQFRLPNSPHQKVE